MNRFKLSPLVLLAVSASLAVLPIHDSIRPESSAMQAASEPAESMLSRPEISAQPSIPLPSSDEIQPPPNTTANLVGISSETGYPDDRVFSVYPELARILALDDLPAEFALTELIPMLADADMLVRLAALESIGGMNHPAVLPMLSAALDDPEPLIRVRVLNALGALHDPLAASSIEAYLFDRETEVRLAAIEALANLEYEPAATALGGLLSDPSTEIRRHAVNALGEIGGQQAVSYLLQAGNDPEAKIRANAATILDELGAAPGY